MTTKRLNLADLKVKSFVTVEKKETVYGGNARSDHTVCAACGYSWVC